MNADPRTPLRKFDVRVGHAVVTVEARDEVEAVSAARERLCQELPRMWDVISQLEVARFEVEALPQGG